MEWEYAPPESEWKLYKKEKVNQEDPEPRCHCGALATDRCAKCCGVKHCGHYACVVYHNRKHHGSKSIFEPEAE